MSSDVDSLNELADRSQQQELFANAIHVGRSVLVGATIAAVTVSVVLALLVASAAPIATEDITLFALSAALMWATMALFVTAALASRDRAVI